MEGTKSSAASAADLEAVLARIEGRLAAIESAVQPVVRAAHDAEKLLATATDIADEKLAKLGDVEGRLSAVSDVLERLSRPQTLASLSKLVDVAENAPGLVATATDILDQLMAEAGEQGLELSQVFDNARRLTFGLLKLTSSPELRALLDSGMLDPRALASLGQLAESLVAVREGGAPRVGMLGALRALGDADVQRALGFALQVAAGFGRTLEATRPTPKQLTTGSR